MANPTPSSQVLNAPTAVLWPSHTHLCLFPALQDRPHTTRQTVPHTPNIKNNPLIHHAGSTLFERPQPLACRPSHNHALELRRVPLDLWLTMATNRIEDPRQGFDPLRKEFQEDDVLRAESIVALRINFLGKFRQGVFPCVVSLLMDWYVTAL